MKLNINNAELNEAIWTCLIEKFFYKTKAFYLIFGNDCKFETLTGAFSDGYANCLSIKNGDAVYNIKFLDGNLVWKNSKKSKINSGYIGIISLCMSHFEFGNDKALIFLKNIFLSFCICSKYDGEYSLRYDDRAYAGEDFIPVSISYKNKNFIKDENYSYYSIKGDLLGKIIKYKCGHDYFELPFFIEKFELPETADRQFIHIPDINFRYHNCLFPCFDSSRRIVFLCDDFILAEKLNFIIHESKNSNFKDKYYALSMQYVVDKSKIEILSNFKNCEIVYIPSATRDSFLQYILFMDKASKLFDIKIYKSSVFIDDGSSVNLELSNFDLFDNYLMQYIESAACLDPQYIGKMYRDAVDWIDFNKWARNIGLLSVNTSKNETGLVDFVDFMKSISVDMSSVDGDYYWDKFFSPQNINLVVAPSHSGKTFFLLTIAYFLSLSLGSFGFKTKNKYNVLYLDGESTDEYFGQMMRSLVAEASHIDARHLPSFHPHLYKQFRGDLDWDFSNDEFLQKVEGWISNGINLVVVDNLNSLAKRFVTSSSKWDSFIQWIDSMQKKYSTAFILAHHSNKNWETLGLESVEGKSHNVIQLFAGNSIISKFEFQSQKDIDSIKKYVAGDNFVMGVNFKKCQSFLNLQDTKHVYYRSKISTEYGCKWEKIYPETQHISNEIDANIANEDLDLSFRLLNYAKKNLKFTAFEAQEYFSVSRSKITGCINSLVGQGVKRCGKGRSTRYIYCDDA